MKRIKPHGPVSPHFMTHYYGAAKPAPVSDDTALLQQALEALLMMRDQYGEDACPACDHADAAVYALRNRLGETK